MSDFAKLPNRDEEPLGFNNYGVGIIEVGEDEGTEDHTVRPLRESLRRLVRSEQLPPAKESKVSTMTGKASIIEVQEDEGLEDNTIRPLRDSLRKLIQPRPDESSSSEETKSA